MTQFLEHFFVVRTFLGCSSEQGDISLHTYEAPLHQLPTKHKKICVGALVAENQAL